MQWFVLGGVMMWPLLLVSILSAVIIIERLFFYSACAFPVRNLDELLADSLRSGDSRPVLEQMEKVKLLHPFCAAARETVLDRETALRLASGRIIDKAGAGLGVLGMLGRIAPLLGLLGTIIGIMLTFSRIASTHGAVDMPLLAGGIWQALITTAAGLIIAVPAVFARHFFLRRRQNISRGLEDVGNTVLALEKTACGGENHHA